MKAPNREQKKLPKSMTYRRGNVEERLRIRSDEADATPAAHDEQPTKEAARRSTSNTSRRVLRFSDVFPDLPDFGMSVLKDIDLK